MSFWFTNGITSVIQVNRMSLVQNNITNFNNRQSCCPPYNTPSWINCLYACSVTRGKRKIQGGGIRGRGSYSPLQGTLAPRTQNSGTKYSGQWVIKTYLTNVKTYDEYARKKLEKKWVEDRDLKTRLSLDCFDATNCSLIWALEQKTTFIYCSVALL